MNFSEISKLKKFIEKGDFQNKKNGVIDRLSDKYSNQYRESISHFDVLFNSERANTILKGNIQYKCLVDYGNLPRKSGLSNIQMKFFREVWTRDEDRIVAGDVVHFAHQGYSDLERYMLLKTIETRDGGYNLSIMQITNGDLKWIDNHGILHSYPFVKSAIVMGNFGVEEKGIILPDERRTITISKTVDSMKITKYQRFIVDGRVWKVITLDRLDDGIVNIVLEEDQYDSSKDNLELEIADYYNRINPPIVIDPDSATLIVSGSDSIRIGQSLLYKVAIYIGEDLIENEPVLFELFNNDGISLTTHAVIENATDVQCNVKGLSIGWVKLKVSLISDSNIYIDKQIQIKGVF